MTIDFMRLYETVFQFLTGPDSHAKRKRRNDFKREDDMLAMVEMHV